MGRRPMHKSTEFFQSTSLVSDVSGVSIRCDFTQTLQLLGSGVYLILAAHPSYLTFVVRRSLTPAIWGMSWSCNHVRNTKALLVERLNMGYSDKPKDASP